MSERSPLVGQPPNAGAATSYDSSSFLERRRAKGRAEQYHKEWKLNHARREPVCYTVRAFTGMVCDSPGFRRGAKFFGSEADTVGCT